MSYYVYAYLREDHTPYYIGKGTGDRAWKKGKGEVPMPADPTRIVIVERNLTNTGALAIERRLIRWYGRKDQGDGILRNKTWGGDGGSGGRAGRTLSDETKKRISDRKKGKKRSPMSEESKRKLSESLKGKNVGKVRTAEHRAMISEKLKGKSTGPKSEETKRKLSQANMGKKRGPQSQEHRENIAKALIGKPRSEEHARKISESLKGKKPSKIQRENYLKAMEENKKQCEHCGRVMTKGNYVRWHGDKCRRIVENESTKWFSLPKLTGEPPVGK